MSSTVDKVKEALPIVDPVVEQSSLRGRCCNLWQIRYKKVKDSLSIVDVVGQYVKLQRAGSSHKGRCPFHSERTPSFFVSPERGTYHCFGCGVGGDMFTFIQEIEGLDFKGALKMLADKAGVPVTYEKPKDRDARERLYLLMETAALLYASNFDTKHPARAYLNERGVTDETIKNFRIGWAEDDWRVATTHLKEKGFSEKEIEAAGIAKKGDKGLYDRFRGRIMFPLFDTAGRIIAFSGRHFARTTSDVVRGGKGNDEVPKYINSPETLLFHKSKVLYGYDRAKVSIRKFNFSLLVEGQMDLIASHQSGWSNAIAVSGTALTSAHVALLRRISPNIVIALDADSAGVRAATKSAHTALAHGMEVKIAALPKGMDPADIVQKEGKEGWSKVIRESTHIISFLLDALREEHKDERKYQKEVEEVVLPFVRDTQNPIDKEKYTHLVAERLRVSDDAIREAISRLPASASIDVHTTESTLPTRESMDVVHSRVKQLFAVLLWQQNEKKPRLNFAEFEKKFKDAISKDMRGVLESIETHEKEALRFAAEALYAGSSALEREMDELVRMVLRERLQNDLQAATTHLKQAEHDGKEKEIKKYLAECKKYTDSLAEVERMI